MVKLQELCPFSSRAGARENRRHDQGRERRFSEYGTRRMPSGGHRELEKGDSPLVRETVRIHGDEL